MLFNILRRSFNTVIFFRCSRHIDASSSITCRYSGVTDGGRSIMSRHHTYLVSKPLTVYKCVFTVEIGETVCYITYLW